MDFLLGHACWHVAGYRDGEPPKIICGARPDPEYVLSGNAIDVILSEMRVCVNCDRVTHGEALRFVNEVQEAMV